MEQAPTLPAPDVPAAPVAAGYERSVRRLTLALMAAWFLASFGVTFFARELDFRVLGWSFSYWMAAQGSLLVFCLINVYYAFAMNRLEARLGLAEEPPWV